MRKLLFILLCFVIGLYRIDFAGWNGSFQQTPILICSVMFLIFYLPSLVFDLKYMSIPKNILVLIVLCILIILWDFIGIDYQDFTQIKRVVLFAYLLLFAITLNLYIYNSKNPVLLIKYLVFFSLITYTLMCGFQYYFFTQNKFYIKGVNSIYPWIELYCMAASKDLPRLNGGFLDPNVAGYFLIFIYFIIKIIDKNKNLLLFNLYVVILIVATFSRSAIVTIFLMIFLDYIRKFNLISFLQFNLNKIIISFLIFIGIAIGINKIIYSNQIETLMQSRITIKDRSAQIHFDLIDYGVDMITDKPSTFITGYGFGSSYLHTQKFFGNNKNGNFHSEMLSIQLETGIIGLFLYLLILVIPLFVILLVSKLDDHSYYLIFMICSVFIENVFYQQFMFHYYWFFVLIPWFWSDNFFKNKLELLK